MFPTGEAIVIISIHRALRKFSDFTKLGLGVPELGSRVEWQLRTQRSEFGFSTYSLYNIGNITQPHPALQFFICIMVFS